MAIDFPDSPSLNDTYVAGGKTYKWDGTAWEIYGPNFNPDILYVDTANNRVGINNTSPTVDLDVTGDAAISGNLDVTGEFTSRGYRYVQTLYYTSSGTFTKASYPWLRAIKVTVVGGGGGGANQGTATEAGAGGNSGVYCESFILSSALSASETVTVGSGGAGGASGGAVAEGAAGGTSSFGTLVVAEGGLGTVANANGPGGKRSAGSQTGDLIVLDSSGGTGSALAVGGGTGGSSPLGGGGRGARPGASTTAEDGGLYGGGGGGSTDTGKGGDGANGIVIVELFA